MNITFLTQAPVYLSDEPALVFTALVDDRSVECTISAEALEDHSARRPGEKRIYNARSRTTVRSFKARPNNC